MSPCGLSEKIVRFRVDKCVHWRIVLSVEMKSQPVSIAIQKKERQLSFLKSVMLFLMMPMMSVLLPVDFFKNEDNFK